MKKEELINCVFQEVEGKDLTKDKISFIFDSIFKNIKKSLIRNNEITLQGFGKFKVFDVTAKKCLNFKQGETVEIADFKSVKFTIQKNFKEELNLRKLNTIL